MYWLYTFQSPEYDKPEEWAIYYVDSIIPAEDFGEEDEAIVVDIICDQFDMLEIGQKDSIYEDSVTNDPTRVLKFLFDQRFR